MLCAITTTHLNSLLQISLSLTTNSIFPSYFSKTLIPSTLSPDSELQYIHSISFSLSLMLCPHFFSYTELDATIHYYNHSFTYTHNSFFFLSPFLLAKLQSLLNQTLCLLQMYIRAKLLKEIHPSWLVSFQILNHRIQMKPQCCPMLCDIFIFSLYPYSLRILFHILSTLL